MSLRGTLWGTAALALGVVLGWRLADREIGRHREDLFHPRALRRLAALNWLEASPDPASVGLVRDYLQWEREPLLLGRARRLLRRLEATFA